MAEAMVNLKLFIEPKSNRVIFAEAQKDFVDFVFHILSLPLASVYKLVRHELGAVGNLYNSIDNLGSNYIQPSQDKSTIFDPKAPLWTNSNPLLLLDRSTTPSFYRCKSCNNSVLYDYYNSSCPTCKYKTMVSLTVTSADPQKQRSEYDGFVTGNMTYMVTDDLVVKPLFTLSTCIDLLQNFDIKHMGLLQQMEVSMGKNEALKILKACVHSNNILTEVFLKPEDDNKNAPVQARVQD